MTVRIVTERQEQRVKTLHAEFKPYGDGISVELTNESGIGQTILSIDDDGTLTLHGLGENITQAFGLRVDDKNRIKLNR